MTSTQQQEELLKIPNNTSSTLSMTPFSINDILSNKKNQKKDELQEKALDMSKANKDNRGNSILQ